MSFLNKISEIINKSIKRVDDIIDSTLGFFDKTFNYIFSRQKKIKSIRHEKDDILDLRIKDLDIGQITDLFKIYDDIAIDETEGDTSIRDSMPRLLDSSSDISDDNLKRLTNFDNKVGYEEFLKKVSKYKIR